MRRTDKQPTRGEERESLPADWKGSLPAIEELENELGRAGDEE